jgi:hypothetical protein
VQNCKEISNNKANGRSPSKRRSSAKDCNTIEEEKELKIKFFSIFLILAVCVHADLILILPSNLFEVLKWCSHHYCFWNKIASLRGVIL